MIQKEKKTQVILENATHEGDTGSPEVQVAILTARINELTADDLRCIGTFASTAASLSTEKSGGIPSIPEKEAVLAAM